LLPDSLLDAKLLECCWRSLESPDERQRILGFDAKPEAGIVARIGSGLMVFETN
jgi:hypothetical protein